MDRDVTKVALALMQSLNTPVSLSVAILIRHSEWDQIANKSVNPYSYLDCPEGVNRYRNDNQAVCFLKKFRDLPTQIDTAQVALEKFLECEQKCAQVNLHIRSVLDNYAEDNHDVYLSSLLRSAKEYCKRVLGRLPEFPRGGFGPGATIESSDYPTKYVTAYDKIAFKTTCTRQWDDMMDCFLTETPLWKPMTEVHPNKFVDVVRGNRFTTVPKTAKTDRPICIEPGLNMFCQKALGSVIRSRLRENGLDLDNNQAIHAALAATASQDGNLSTIDLSSASDSISYELVKALLPEDWFNALVHWRSPLTQLPDGNWLRNEKFSSMGNGFTFELETLVFASLVTAAGGIIGGDSYVYGDDIIVPDTLAYRVLYHLSLCGFTANEDKTFITGRFFESCGADYFLGQPVRAVYLQSVDSPIEWIALCNSLFAFDEHLTRLARSKAYDAIPRIYRIFGPPFVENGVIHTHDRSKWQTRTEGSIRFFRCVKVLSASINRGRYSGYVQLAAALMGYGAKQTPRGAVTGFRVGWTPFS